MSDFEEVKTGNPSHQGWPYSEAVRAGDFIFVAGIAAEDETTGQMNGETIEQQTRFAFAKIGRILSHADADMRDVCRVAVHLADIDHFQRFSDTFAEIFQSVTKQSLALEATGNASPATKNMQRNIFFTIFPLYYLRMRIEELYLRLPIIDLSGNIKLCSLAEYFTDIISVHRI